MANTIRIKRSTGNDAPTSLANAELAFAEGSKKLFIGIGTGGDGGSATTIEAIGGSGAFVSSVTARNTNLVFAGPASGSAAAPAFRSLAVADIPTLTSSIISDFNTTVRNNRIDQLVSPIGSLNLNSQKITSLATPTSDNDAANKGYVDSVAEGLDVKDSCTVASTANVTIATALNNGDVFDSVALSTGDRVLLKDQTNATENGIYIVGASPARADDLAAGADAAGAFTFIEQGTSADKGFVCTSNKGSAVVGTNNLAFSTFSSSGDVSAGNGLSKSGNTLSASLVTNGGLIFSGTSIKVDLDAASIGGKLAVNRGGTNATSASGARTSLGLVIGTDVEAHSDKLTELATMNLNTAQKLADLTNTEVGVLDGITATTAELNRVDATSSIQTQLDSKQASDTQLTDIAALAVTNGGFIVGNGTTFVLETGATARTSMGLGSMATQNANSVNIDGGTIDGITLDGGSY
tara:strand:- start:3550 stop:4947 length:1398 start_codon:yes stop_codon:yes gene_type:complete